MRERRNGGARAVGVSLALRSVLLAYWSIVFAGANLFVIGYEEPSLRRRFGEPYDRYTEQVGRWLPRLTARGRIPPAGSEPS